MKIRKIVLPLLLLETLCSCSSNISLSSADSNVAIKHVVDIDMENYWKYIDFQVNRFINTSTGMLPITFKGKLSYALYENCIFKYVDFDRDSGGTWSQYTYNFYLDASGSGYFEINDDLITSIGNKYEIESKFVSEPEDEHSKLISCEGTVTYII